MAAGEEREEEKEQEGEDEGWAEVFSDFRFRLDSGGGTEDQIDVNDGEG